MSEAHELLLHQGDNTQETIGRPRRAIRILDPLVAARVAAAEAITGAGAPAVIVKELVENAIDAGATSIRVTVEDGGVALLRVDDDGCGIPADEARLAFARHATNKIEDIEDVWAIHSLGFRGEALASIAAIAHVELVTAADDAPRAVRIEANGIDVGQPRVAARPRGTTVTVRDIFASIPARQRFLRSRRVEATAVKDTLQRYALARPEIRLSLEIDGRPVFSSPGVGDLRAVVAAVWGADVAAQMLDVAGEVGHVSVRGLVGPSTLYRPSRSAQAFAVNGRWVQNRMLGVAVQEAFRTYMLPERHAVCALHIDLPPDVLDVNAHPAKTEVKFLNERDIFRAIRSSVLAVIAPTNDDDTPENVPRDTTEADLSQAHGSQQWEQPLALFSLSDEPATHSPTPDVGQDISPPYPVNSLVAETCGDSPHSSALSVTRTEENAYPPNPHLNPPNPHLNPPNPHGNTYHNATVGTVESTRSVDNSPTPRRGDWRLIGQLHDAYILVETDDGLVVLETHAAHERLLYDEIVHAASVRGIDRQPFLTAVTIDLTPAQDEAISTYSDEIAALGFEIDPFGCGTGVLRAVPAILANRAYESVLQHLLESLVTRGPSADWRDRLFATMACKAAVKTGQPLTRDEMERLVRGVQNMGARHPAHCPHGRPISSTLTLSDLQRGAGRHA